jgi:hypothetical protein
VKAALGWCLAQARGSAALPILVAEAEALAGFFAGESSRRPEKLEVLLKFAQTMTILSRQHPEVPGCNLGDALTALGALVLADDQASPWEYRPTLSADGWSKLGFAGVSSGIAETQRTNKEGWWAHARRNRAFVLEAADATSGKHLCVVLGSGQAFDLPLSDLATRFERLVLIDVDQAALEATITSAIKDPALRARVEGRVLDLTGINSEMVERLDDAARRGGSAEDLTVRLEQICRSYQLAAPPVPLPPGQRADLVISGMVLTQLPFPQRTYAQAIYEKRFGRLDDGQAARWNSVWGEFLLRLQQDHINGLTLAAELAALTTDTIIRPTELDPGGSARPTGAQIRMLGVASVLERIPRFITVERHASWTWERLKPDRRGASGSSIDVEGVILREAAGLP